MSLEKGPGLLDSPPESVPAERERQYGVQEFIHDHVTPEMRAAVKELLAKKGLPDVYDKMEELAESAEDNLEQLAEAWLLLTKTYGSNRKDFADFFQRNPHYEFPGEREVRKEIYLAFPEYNLGFEKWLEDHPRDDSK